MGLYLYLKENFPQIETDLYLESVPEAYSMIRHTDEVKSELPEGKIYDLFICMDCGDLQRLGFRCKTIRQILRQRDRITGRLGELAQPLRAEAPVGSGTQRQTDTDPHLTEPKCHDRSRQTHQKPCRHVGCLRGHRSDPRTH